jgi:glutamate transport system permease protein
MSASVLFDNPGPRARVRHRIIAVVSGVLVLGALAVAAARFADKGNLAPEKWTPFVTADIWVNYFIPGLINTLEAAFISMGLAGIFGVLFGMGRLSHNPAIRWIATVVVEFFRSVPVLVMMFFTFYFVSKYFANELPANTFPLVAVITGLTLYNGSVVAELIRSGVGSLPKGQTEAGLAIGLTRGQTLRTILLPQAITAMLPALVGQLVVVLKDTALGQIVLYPELLTTYKQIGSYKSNPVPALLVIALIYIGINYAVTSLAGYLERRTRQRGRPTIPAKGVGAVVPAVDLEPIDTARQHADDELLRAKYPHHGHTSASALGTPSVDRRPPADTDVGEA